MKIKNRKQFADIIGGGVYAHIYINYPKLLEKYLPSLKKKRTKEDCHKEALKYNSRKEWKTKDQASYAIANRNKWTDYCCSHMEKIKGKWNKRTIKTEALKYKTVKEWRDNSIGSYDAAHRKYNVNDFIKHMVNANFKCILNTSTNKMFPSRQSASEYYNIDGASISKAATKKTKNCWRIPLGILRRKRQGDK